MRRVVRFYQNIQHSTGEDKKRYKIDEILKEWSDYQFQVRKNYIRWLFPLETDPQETRLVPGLRYKFQKNPGLRSQVIKAVVRFMSFLGYTVKIADGKPVDVVQIKPVHREQNHIVIGLYNPENYDRITRILQFLQEIRMYELGAIFFLMLCRSMQENPDLKHLITTNLVLQDWMKTQPYLVEKRYQAEEALVGEELESWEKSNSLSSQEQIVRDAWK